MGRGKIKINSKKDEKYVYGEELVSQICVSSVICISIYAYISECENWYVYVDYMYVLLTTLRKAGFYNGLLATWRM